MHMPFVSKSKILKIVTELTLFFLGGQSYESDILSQISGLEF